MNQLSLIVPSLVSLQLLFCLHQTHAYSIYDRNPIQILMDAQSVNITEGEQRTVYCTINRGPLFFFESPLRFVHKPRKCANLGVHRCRDRIMATNGLLFEAQPEFYDAHVNQSNDRTVFEFVYKKARDEDSGVLTCQLLIWDNLMSTSTEIEVEHKLEPEVVVDGEENYLLNTEEYSGEDFFNYSFY